MGEPAYTIAHAITEYRRSAPRKRRNDQFAFFSIAHVFATGWINDFNYQLMVESVHQSATASCSNTVFASSGYHASSLTAAKNFVQGGVKKFLDLFSKFQRVGAA